MNIKHYEQQGTIKYYISYKQGIIVIGWVLEAGEAAVCTDTNQLEDTNGHDLN